MKLVVMLLSMGTFLFPLHVQSQSSSVTTNSAVTAGSSQVENINGSGNAQTLAITGGQSPAQLPMTTQVQPMGPNIYGPLGGTPGSASVPFIAAASKLCGVRYTKKYMPVAKATEKTKSDQTRVSFNQFPSLQVMNGSPVEVEEIDPPDLTAGVYHNVKCLGTLTMWTKEAGGTSTDFGVIQSDAMHHLFDTVRGYPKVALVSLIQAVSAASGASTEGWSLGIGGAFGHIVSALTSAGIAPTFSKGSGQTNPTNFPGGTFLVIALDQPDGQTIDMARLREFFTPPRIEQPVVVVPENKK